MSASSLTLTDCTLSGNEGYFGGAVYGPVNGQLLIERCSISGNSARGGGGLYTSGGRIADSTITDNLAEGGGGLLNVRNEDPVGLLDLTGTSISGNTGTSNGGALALGGQIDVLGGLVSLNEAPYGAGVYSSDTVGTLQEMVIEANVSSGADSAGGGLYVDSDASLTLTDCTVDDNSTEGWGGGLYTGGANIVFEGGAVTSNRALEGGGLMVDGWPTVLIDGVDFGTDASDNQPSDLYLSSIGAVYTAFGASTTVTCTPDRCS